MAAVLQAIALISEPPGSYIYQVILLGVMSIIAARSAAVGARREALVFFGLAGLRLGALVILPLTNGLPIYQLVIFPPFDRAVACLSIVGLIWAFTYPRSGRLANGLAAAAVLLTSAAAVASWLVWVDSVGAGSVFYNGTLQDTLWLTAQLFLLAGGLIVLALQRPSGWAAGLVLLALLLVSEGLHYFFPIADANVPGFVRYAELIVWPLAAVILWRRPRPAAESASAAAAAQPSHPSAYENATPEALRAELDAANRRNQQLRETNRQSRQQLAAAAEALADYQARLAAAEPAREANGIPDATGNAEALEAARAELAAEQASRTRAEESVHALQERLSSLETLLQAAGESSAEAAQAAEELLAARQLERSQSESIAQLEARLDAAQGQQAEQAAARLAAENRLASLEAALLAADDKSNAAAQAAAELSAVRQVAQSQTQLVTDLGEQLTAALAQQQEQVLARQAAEERLAETLASEQALTGQLAQAGTDAAGQLDQLRAELAAAQAELARQNLMEAELRETQSALARAQAASEQAHLQLAEQAAQLKALQEQLALRERRAGERSERNGPADRRRPAAKTGAKEDKASGNAAGPPKNGAAGRENATEAVSGNGHEHAGPVRASLLAADLKPELTPTISGPVCPHLGLLTDRPTRHAFPSELNRCFGLAEPGELSFEQQRRYCLSGAHVDCPIFTGELVNPSLPIDTSPPPPEARPPQSLGRRVGRFFRRKS